MAEFVFATSSPSSMEFLLSIFVHDLRTNLAFEIISTRISPHRSSLGLSLPPPRSPTTLSGRKETAEGWKQLLGHLARGASRSRSTRSQGQSLNLVEALRRRRRKETEEEDGRTTRTDDGDVGRK